jgi:ATP-dependent DNA helicase RecQ
MLTLADARATLEARFGYARFRTAQLPVIKSLITGADTLAVLATGGGKSICFQVPALLDGGVTLVISPLVALMHDQVAALVRRGVDAVAFDGTQAPTHRLAALERAAAGGTMLVYVSPEGLPRTVTELESRAVRPVRLVIDEAHCISEWGHDFRPAYRALHLVRERLGDMPVAALTGSATPDVRRDIRAVLRLGADRPFHEHLSSFDRANLSFAVQRAPDDTARLALVLASLRDRSGLSLVYVPTRGLCEGLVRILRSQGLRAEPYHAKLDIGQRQAVLERFQGAELDVVVATCAFGMGIDQPRVRLVVHWGLPATPESYYQEAGRAGRDGQPARCLAIVTSRDTVLHRRQLAMSLPSRQALETVWGDPSGRHAASVRGAADRLRDERDRSPDASSFWRGVDRRRRAAEQRLEAIDTYATTMRCRRSVLLGWFGERVVGCTACDRCTGTR